MGWYLGFALSLSVAVSALAESGPVDHRPAGAESEKTPAPMILAQFNIGRILAGDSENADSDHNGGRHTEYGKGHITSTPPPSSEPDDDHGSGGFRPFPIPTIPTIPIPLRPYRPYRPGPNYVPRPDYPIGPTITPVPSNVLPIEPETTVEPEVNLVLIEPEPNNFLDGIGIRPITPQQLEAFKKQLIKKNDQLGGDLKKLLPGNDKAIDQLVALANAGKLNAQLLQQFVGALGGNLNLPLQLQATALFRHLVFNNLAMAALLNVNLNLLNLNIVNININVIGVGLGGFWGFPQWPWNYPVWLGPGVWWGPCAYCPFPYYNPYLNGAAILGIPYSFANPIPNYAGRTATGGILLMNAGGSAVNYTVDGRRYAMKPNYQQAIARTRVVITFDRGGSFGNARYAIDEGWYKFTVTDRGWELYKHTAKVTLDNSDNSFPFRYVLDNQRHTLQPGYRQQLTGKYPLELKFGDGKGQIIRKVLSTGEFKVAVGGSGGLDLFRPEDVIMPAPVAEMAKKAEAKTPNIFAEPEKIPDLFGDTATNSAPVPAPPPEAAAPAPPSLFGPE